MQAKFLESDSVYGLTQIGRFMQEKILFDTGDEAKLWHQAD
jgi:hypothetical protein